MLSHHRFPTAPPSSLDISPSLQNDHHGAPSLPYPEGQVFFKTSALKQTGFTASDQEQFYGHFLVEYVWNNAFMGGDALKAKEPLQAHAHAGGVQTEYAQWYGTKFAYFKSMDVNFGNKREGGNIKRRVVSNNNGNYNEMRDRDSGGPNKVRCCPIQMGPEKYAFLDLTNPIRAIYFPLAAKASAISPDLCSYLMVDFRFRNGVSNQHALTHHREQVLHPL